MIVGVGEGDGVKPGCDIADSVPVGDGCGCCVKVGGRVVIGDGVSMDESAGEGIARDVSSGEVSGTESEAHPTKTYKARLANKQHEQVRIEMSLNLYQ